MGRRTHLQNAGLMELIAMGVLGIGVLVAWLSRGYTLLTFVALFAFPFAVAAVLNLAKGLHQREHKGHEKRGGAVLLGCVLLAPLILLVGFMGYAAGV